MNFFGLGGIVLGTNLVSFGLGALGFGAGTDLIAEGCAHGAISVLASAVISESDIGRARLSDTAIGVATISEESC